MVKLQGVDRVRILAIAVALMSFATMAAAGMPTVVSEIIDQAGDGVGSGLILPSVFSVATSESRRRSTGRS